jgi:hypothetical protein
MWRAEAEATQLDEVRAELIEARAAAEAAKRRAAEATQASGSKYPTRLRFVCGIPKYDRPFLVRAIWHDGQFAYIKADADELPALYEVKDGTPAL